ncbi:hypothetical protein [Oceaniglobus roseus]|uniref:hypothetical protein n=1 Tax=Oceaniglobus roseus TaxID=1737570 RepID=UPI000C7F68F8|nr:hypothetical protein [Kandeliimicrobium roseum]
MFKTLKIAAPLTALALLASPVYAQATVTNTEDAVTVETAKIAPDASVEGMKADDVVMATSGELLGKIVSVVPRDGDTTQYIIQVDQTVSPGAEKNVTLDSTHFSRVGEDYVVNADYNEFLMLVEEQNPA